MGAAVVVVEEVVVVILVVVDGVVVANSGMRTDCELDISFGALQCLFRVDFEDKFCCIRLL